VEEGLVPFYWLGAALGNLNNIDNFSLSMFAKTNESINLRIADGIFGVKPRSIVCLPLILQLHIQPWVRRATANFKRFLRIPFCHGGVWHWFTYAGGMNSADLDEWVKIARALAELGWVAAIFMGDDSLIIDGRYRPEQPGVKIVEIDYSHYDQSQCRDFIDLDTAGLLKLGVPSTVCEILEKISASKAVARRSNGLMETKITFTPGFPRRCSGTPNTALSNTFNNMLAIVQVGFSNYTQESFRKVGLKAKIKYPDDILSATFLKGKWWLALDGSFHWASLVGRIMKLTKVGCLLKTPTEMATMAYAIAQNMGEIDVTFPILGPFRQKLLDLSERDRDITKLQLQKFDFGYSQHRIRNQQFAVDRHSALNDICERYTITLEQIEEM
jgi:hypothetical protein